MKEKLCLSELIIERLDAEKFLQRSRKGRGPFQTEAGVGNDKGF